MDPDKIRQVMSRTGADEATARAALKTSEGNVAIAVRIVQSYSLKEDNAAQQETQGSAGAKTGQGTGEDTSGQSGYAGRNKDQHQMPDADDIIEAIKEIWKKGNASRLDIEKQGRVVLSVSLVVGTIGFVLAPVAALIGIGTALITEYTIRITLDDGTVINVNEFAVTRKQSSQTKDARDVTPDQADRPNSQ